MAGTGSAYKGSSLTALYEFQRKFDVYQNRHLGQIYYYAGFGAHVGRYAALTYRKPNKDFYTEDVFTAGVDAILGVEFVFSAFPVAAGVDVKPFFNILGPGQHFFDTALNLRLTF